MPLKIINKFVSIQLNLLNDINFLLFNIYQLLVNLIRNKL